MHYTEFTVLKVNYEKSFLVPIKVAPQQIPGLLNILGYRQGQMPFTYLGLPMGTSKPKIEDFGPMMQKFERRLLGCSTMLTYDDRLLLIKSVFVALPIFYMSTVVPRVGVIEQINKYLRIFL